MIKWVCHKNFHDIILTTLVDPLKSEEHLMMQYYIITESLLFVTCKVNHEIIHDHKPIRHT